MLTLLVYRQNALGVPSFRQNDDGLCIDCQRDAIFRVDILQSICK